MDNKVENKKKPRTDKRKNVWKVAEVLAKNPNKTIREIAEETNLSIGAVHSSKVEVEKNWTKDETITYIVDKSKQRIKKVQELFDRYVNEVTEKEKLEKNDVALVKDIVKDDLQRVTVFGGNVTDNAWWLSAEAIKNMSVDELLSLIKK